ncbi:hypothetical protein OIDMADRAFT_37964 [Oidiodendron maius Zn]|uniref:Major facilitator superfamily (MFS) profile domain-containing protein n=1 Tax=Oidiodendron maius (strain Zn) TaxID=913774 RepID=A0A0C3HLG3_OIDMZ|nr:hypothetical protein OIDMADRAFT_37964 [Oidiodendron maius Zn]
MAGLEEDISALGTASVDKKTKNPNEINWAGENDQLNPRNWPVGKKWLNLSVISVMTLSTPLASSMFAPGAPQAMREFHSDNSNLETFVVSIFVLGFAFGPLLVAPLSEIYGRRPIYVLSNLLFCIFTMACALSKSLGMLIAFRFLAGCAGSTPVTLGGATIGDTFPKDKRGAAMALWGMGPLLGPIIGPIIGGYLSQAKGWRWVFWLQLIASGATFVLGLLLLKESYSVVILEGKAELMRKETGNQDLVSALHHGLTRKSHFTHAIVRPTKMLLLSPIVMLLSIYTAFLFGYLYLFITTFPRVFTGKYHFSVNSSGLAYIGLGVGCFFGLIMAGKGSDVVYKKLEEKNGGEGKSEFRLPLLVISAPLVAIAFFWYGWSVEAKVHWIIPILGSALFGMGMMPGFICINMYLVHSFGVHSASAIAASKVLQSIGGALLPLVAEPMYDRLGLGWGNSVLAFIALAFVPVPWILFRYGGLLRARERARF